MEWRCLAAASPLQAMSFAQRLAKKADEFEARKKAEEQKRDAEEAAQIHAWVSGWQKKDTIFASIKNNKTLEKNAEFDKCKLKGHLNIFFLCLPIMCAQFVKVWTKQFVDWLWQWEANCCAILWSE